MKLSPLDIRHKEFQSALNGFNKGQVRDFLDRVADQFEERLEQVQLLNEQLKKQEKEIEQLRVSDIELKRTLVTSERLSGEVKLQAEREAELLLKETQSKADIILRDAELQKRQLLKTAETQISEATLARQKAEEAAKHIREQSIQEAAVQKQRAQNMVAGIKEQLPNTNNPEISTKEQAQELNRLKHKSKTIIGQLQKDITELKAERGQMLEQLNNYKKHPEITKHKEVTNKTKSMSHDQPKVTALKTKQVAHALSTSIDNLIPTNFSSDFNFQALKTPNNSPNSSIADVLLSAESLGLNSSLDNSLNSSLNNGLDNSTVHQANHPQTNIAPTITPAITSQRKQSNSNTAHDISYPKIAITQTETPFQQARPLDSDKMNLSITEFKENNSLVETKRQAKERQIEKDHFNNQQLHFVETEQTYANGLSQHIYPHPVKESSVQDRGRLITPLTIHDTIIHDITNPFINDGFDEIDSLGTFSEAMLSKDSGLKSSGLKSSGLKSSKSQDQEFDNNILSVEDTLLNVEDTLLNIETKNQEFDNNILSVEDTLLNVEDTLLHIEDTLELPNPHTTVEHIEVLDTEWFENFELEDD